MFPAFFFSISYREIAVVAGIVILGVITVQSLRRRK